MIDLPKLALSVRQPWAWSIIHGVPPKDIENRTPTAIQKGRMTRGHIAIHAAKGMTRDEYESARRTMADIGLICPAPAELLRGGIIGSVEVVDIVKASLSPWFFGPRGLVLRNPKPCRFTPAVGQLGYFEWQPADASIVPEPARWMLPKADPDASKIDHNGQVGMFE